MEHSNSKPISPRLQIPLTNPWGTWSGKLADLSPEEIHELTVNLLTQYEASDPDLFAILLVGVDPCHLFGTS